ncbi:hypothetical protein [Pyruvatibacter sp.]|uniref:hypothetical protein n=1 Tax=Pyruvatibacter sp. TaxID=1981328 RepID=UPI003263E517
MTTGAQAHIEGTSHSAAARPQAATLYLALFLALLAFFLFLTSISTFDPARAVSVIDSVEAQFARAVEAQAGPELVTPHFAGPAGQHIVADAAFTSRVATAFEDIAGRREDLAVTDGVAWHGVRLDASALFVRDTAALSATGRQALEAAASAMAVQDAGTGSANRRVDIAVGGERALALRRAVALASIFTGVNGPEAVSLRTIDATNTAEMVFYAVAGDTARGGRS